MADTYKIRRYDQHTKQWVYTDVEYGTNPSTGKKLKDRTQSVVDSNRAFREADKASTKTRSRERDDYERTSRTDPSTTVDSPQKRSINDFTYNKTKSAKYRQLSTNLANLASSYTDSAGTREGVNAGVTGALSLIGGIAGAIFGGAGYSIGSGIGGILGGLFSLGNSSSGDKKKAQLYTTMAGNITDYLTNLTNRDTVIMNTMDQLYSSMDNMRATYGSDFVDIMYNYYLGKSGMTSDAYSMLTGNFENFELGDGAFGTQSTDDGMFDSLTAGNRNLFDNVYAQLQLGDITSNRNLMDSMVQSLYGGDTEMAIQLRQYEQEVRDALTASANQQSQLMFNARDQLETAGAQSRAQNIQYAENIGSAEADSASSGGRGGTSYSNANLQKLMRDLGQIQMTADVASIFGSFKYNMQNAQLNASSTAYSYRIAQKRMITGAVNGAAVSFNSVGRTLQSGERQSNYYLDEASSNQRQFNENWDKISKDADKDKIVASV